MQPNLLTEQEKELDALKQAQVDWFFSQIEPSEVIRLVEFFKHRSTIVNFGKAIRRRGGSNDPSKSPPDKKSLQVVSKSAGIR